MSAPVVFEVLRAKLGAMDAPALTRKILPFLLAQRWFRRHTQPPRHVHLESLAPLSPNLISSVVVVGEHNAEQVRYFFPMFTCSPDEAPPGGTVFDAHDLDLDVALIDAAQHPEARRKLVQVIVGQVRTRAGDGLWEGRAFSDTQALHSLPSRVLTAEQSNTSIVYGNQAILKLFRCVQYGRNPDVEMTQYLTVHHPLPYVPRLLGTLGYRGSTQGIFDAAMLQEFIADGTDGWALVLTELAGWLRRDAPANEMPAIHAAQGLGQALRKIHEVLAQPRGEEKAFAAQKATAAHLKRWQQEAREQALASLTCLQENQKDMPDALRAQAAVLLAYLGNVAGHEVDVSAALPRLDASDAGACIRHHGDLHLGQVLRRHNGSFSILDFEGEPLRPLDARRRPHSPLRDVAGMLRSFAYAAQTASRENKHFEAPARSWEQAMRDTFVKAYLAGPSNPKLALLPQDAAHTKSLLQLFVQEKAFYELRYELLHRPSWVGVPLQGILQSLPRERA